MDPSATQFDGYLYAFLSAMFTTLSQTPFFQKRILESLKWQLTLTNAPVSN